MLRIALQRHATLGYLALAAAALIWILPANALVASQLAIAGVAAGVAFLWIASAVWGRRERWSVRVQSAIVALAVTMLISSHPEPDVAAAGLLVFMAAAAFLSISHTTAQLFARVREHLVSPGPFARVEAARQTLFIATWAVPIVMGLAPNPVSAVVLALSLTLVNAVLARMVRRRLTAGLSHVDAS